MKVKYDCKILATIYICLIKCYIHVQEEEEQFGPLLVGTLEQHGIAATDVKKLMVSFFSRLMVIDS